MPPTKSTKERNAWVEEDIKPDKDETKEPDEDKTEVPDRGKEDTNITVDLAPGPDITGPAEQEAPKLVRYRCIKKCHHYVGANSPETRRIYEPGDTYMAREDEEVPHHFRRVENQADEVEVSKLIDENLRKDIPDFINRKKPVEI